jgi:hypothetical protein
MPQQEGFLQISDLDSASGVCRPFPLHLSMKYMPQQKDFLWITSDLDSAGMNST